MKTSNNKTQSFTKVDEIGDGVGKIGSSKPSDPSDRYIRSFRFQKLLNQDPAHHTINLLGTILADNHEDPKGTDDNDWCDTQRAILIINKTHFPTDTSYLSELTSTRNLRSVKSLGNNDVYHWCLGYFGSKNCLEDDDSDRRGPDLKFTLIAPATDLHINKYSKQTFKMIRETPDLYKRIVLPYIESIPSTRLNWLYNILEGKTESEKVIYRDPSPKDGFIIIPDLKWDQSTISSLYLICITNDRSIRSMRDLTYKHLKLLRSIRSRSIESVRTLKSQIELRRRMMDGTTSHNVKNPTVDSIRTDDDDDLTDLDSRIRLFVHYQPSYYHFHVHITHIDNIGLHGTTVGQSHLLDDIIDNLQLLHPLITSTSTKTLQVNSNDLNGNSSSCTNNDDDDNNNNDDDDDDDDDDSVEKIGFYQKKTFFYGLGTNHNLFEQLWKNQ
ncbi:HIT-like domain-containing protein [Phakopsora pachyrhizi]|uniref:HIT-like domain-containing protein n=1 Tax=Phakopsora pachyrhizi TaxID=170000 RepID=A0AAV0AJW6_PHAPC|nr:HIT-like domain-containing protein [Phakopsora pachyrhizi]CAH7668839.1 HIT-like domain-containing protein [Phakopsora pachyrhizi]